MKERLRALRLENGLTQKQLAEKLNSTDKSIWAYENGVALPPLDILKAYADFFQVSIDYLVGSSDDLGMVTIQSGAPDLSAEEKELVRRFRPLARPLKDLIFSMLDTWEQQAAAENGSKKHA